MFPTEITTELAALEFVAAKDGEGELQRFKMTAYTGAAMRKPGIPYPVVIDLASLQSVKAERPVLWQHDQKNIVGHTVEIVNNGRSITASGVVSGTGEKAREFADNARNGFPWQASVGVDQIKAELIPAGQSVNVNGRLFRGPIVVGREGRLYEISTVPLGKDDDTQTRLAAQRNGAQEMEFKQWLIEAGFEEDKLSEKQLKTLKAAFESGGDDPAAKKGGKGPTRAEVSDAVADVRAQLAEEHERIAAVRTAGEGHDEIIAQAIKENRNSDWVELQVMRASRDFDQGKPTASSIKVGEMSESVLECALSESLGIESKVIEAGFDDKTRNAAKRYGGIGLKDLTMLCARMASNDAPAIFGDGEMAIKAAFSTSSLANITENVLGKAALEAYQAQPIQALELARVSSVRDFKQVSRVRMLGTGKWNKVAGDGELKHGIISDEKFTNKADTYGQILTIDRQTIIDDDLQIIRDAGDEMGFQGAEIINELFFLKLLNPGAGYFTDGENQLAEDPTTAFGSGSLNALQTIFRKQKAGPGTKAKDKRPININPEILLVPVEKKFEADQLIGSANLAPSGDTDRTIGTSNPHSGAFRVVTAPHLSDTFYTGNSETAFFLLANPRRLPALELVFLNGRKTPTIERVAPPANVLGIGFRGYIDVGCNVMDPRGIARSPGA